MNQLHFLEPKFLNRNFVLQNLCFTFANRKNRRKMDISTQSQHESSMTDRIQTVMKTTKMSQQDFAKKLGISPASLSSILNNRTNPTANHVRAIHAAFPNINVAWLMFGEGDMLLHSTDEESASLDDVPKVDRKSVEEEAGEGALAFVEETRESRSAHALARSAVHEAALAKMAELSRREIVEIRVFFDDGTYESFVPSRGAAK